MAGRLYFYLLNNDQPKHFFIQLTVIKHEWPQLVWSTELLVACFPVVIAALGFRAVDFRNPQPWATKMAIHRL